MQLVIWLPHKDMREDLSGLPMFRLYEKLIQVVGDLPLLLTKHVYPRLYDALLCSRNQMPLLKEHP